MSTINDSDQFLVQRGQNSHKQSAKDLMSTIQDTDLMLIQRGTESFKVTCEDVKDQLGGGGASAPVLDSVTLAQDGSPNGNRFTSNEFTSTTVNFGGAATELHMTATVTGNLGIKAGSDPIQSNPYTGTAAGTSVALTLTGNTNLGTVIEAGDTVTANVSYTPETDTISSVNGNVLTLPTEKDIKLFQVDDEVQAGVKVTATDVSAKTITVDGGSWTANTDKVSTTSAKQGSGTVATINGTQITISPFTDNCFKEGQWLTVNKAINVNPKTDKINSYNAKVIAVDGDTDLNQFAAGDSVFMTDNSGSGASTKTGYTLTTSTISNVTPDTNAYVGFVIDNDGSSFLSYGLYDSGNTNLGADNDTINASWRSQNYFNDNINDSEKSAGNGNVGLYIDSQTSRFRYSGLTPGDTVQLVYGSGSNSSENQTCTISGDIIGGINNDQDFPSSGKGDSTKRANSFQVSAESGTITIYGSSIFIHYFSLFAEARSSHKLEFSSPNPDLKYFKPRDVIGAEDRNYEYKTIDVSSDVSVVSVDPDNNTMTVSGGNWSAGNAIIYATTGGTGTIATNGVSVTNKTITLDTVGTGDARWIADNKAGTVFRVATATKPAVASTAYLKFSADGAVTGYQATPVDPRSMDNKIDPKLTFPATFPDTGQAPDAEFADTSAYIQTSVQLKNTAGDSATKDSNKLVPQTTRSIVGPGELENNTDELKAMATQIATHDQRVADHTAAERQSRIDDFEAALERYSHDHD